MGEDTKSPALTAAERRERRMQRILSNSDSRMNKILSGPNGDEKRHAPLMEGGEGFLTGPPSAISPAVENCNTPGTDVPIDPIPLSFVDNVRSFSKQWKSLFIFLFGLLSRISFVVFEYETNLLLPWIVVYVSMEVMLNKDNRASDLNSELMQTIKMFLPPAQLSWISRAGSLFSIFRNFVQDSMTMVTGFLLTHTGFVLGRYFQLV